MVNNCPFCTVMALGVIIVTCITGGYFGFGAMMMVLTVIVLMLGIMFHAVNKMRKDEIAHQDRLNALRRMNEFQHVSTS